MKPMIERTLHFDLQKHKDGRIVARASLVHGHRQVRYTHPISIDRITADTLETIWHQVFTNEVARNGHAALQENGISGNGVDPRSVA